MKQLLETCSIINTFQGMGGHIYSLFLWSFFISYQRVSSGMQNPLLPQQIPTPQVGILCWKKTPSLITV